jgi:hypothetical protein
MATLESPRIKAAATSTLKGMVFFHLWRHAANACSGGSLRVLYFKGAKHEGVAPAGIGTAPPRICADRHGRRSPSRENPIAAGAL